MEENRLKRLWEQAEEQPASALEAQPLEDIAPLWEKWHQAAWTGMRYGVSCTRSRRRLNRKSSLIWNQRRMQNDTDKKCRRICTGASGD